MDDEGRRDRPQYGGGVAAIREAALAVATEKGLSGVTLRAVAERAHVSHALVRHHFGTRDKLIAATVAAAVDRTQYLDSADAPLSGRIDGTLGELRVQYEAMLAGDRSDAIEDAYARYRGEVEAWLSAGSGDTRPDPAVVQLVVAALDGLALQRLARGAAVDVDAAFAVLRRMLERA